MHRIPHHDINPLSRFLGQVLLKRLFSLQPLLNFLSFRCRSLSAVRGLSQHRYLEQCWCGYCYPIVMLLSAHSTKTPAQKSETVSLDCRTPSVTSSSHCAVSHLSSSGGCQTSHRVLHSVWTFTTTPTTSRQNVEMKVSSMAF